MGSIRNHEPYDGFLASVFCAVGKIKPVPQTVTVATSAPAKGSTTITVTALSEPIDKDNYLLFTDPTTGLEYLALVTADADAADTTLTVSALDVTIPVGAVAQFPSEILDRTECNVDRAYNSESFTTLNTGGKSVVKLTNSEATVSAPGFYHHYNAGYRTAAKAAEAKKSVWLRIEYPAPDANFSKGEIIEGLAVLTSRPNGNPAESYMTGDLEFSFSGDRTETAPTPTA